MMDINPSHLMAAKVINNTVNTLFYLALIVLLYNCDYCGGPRMW